MSEQQAREALGRIGSTLLAGHRADAVLTLGCILVPSDGLALFLFSGPVLGIRLISQQAELPFDRIVESFPIFLPTIETAGH